MEQKMKALKVSSKVISVITKIGYTAMIVLIAICACMLIFMAVSGGEVSMLTIGGTNIIFFDEATSTPAEITAVSSVLIVVGGIFLAIFLLAYRMFHEISQTGDPFKEKYVKTVRVIGILTAAMPIVVGFAGGIASIISASEMPEIFSDLPGIVVGAILFCLSYVIDYGCGLEGTPDASHNEKISQ